MDFKSWKRKNVTLRGISTDIRTENSAGARFGNGLYTAALSNRKMASGYGNVYYVVGAIPKNPKIFNDANQAEIWVQRFVYDWMKKHLNIDNHLDSREFYKKTDLATEMIKAGFDGIIIKGREMVNYKPDEDEIKYFSNDWQLEDYFERTILNESMNQDFKDIFQKRWEAIDNLKDQGIKNLKVNSDATLTLYHLTPKENVASIKRNGFKSGTYFSISKSKSYKNDFSSIQAIQKFGDNAEFMEIKVDPRFLEPINNNKDLYSKNQLILDDNVFTSKLDESQINNITNKLLEMEDKPKCAGLRKKSNDIDKALKAELSKANYNKKLADKKKEEYYRKLKNKNIKESEEKSYLPLFKNGKSILDYNYAYKNEYFVDLDKLEGYNRKVIQTYLRKSENGKLFVLNVTKSFDIIYVEVSYIKNPKFVQESTMIPFDCLYE